jgi:hypothetical protein
MASKRVLHVVPPGGAPARNAARVLIADDGLDNATTLE